MHKRYIIYIYIVLSLLMLSCNGARTGSLAEKGDTLRLHYARNLTIVTFSDRTEVTLRNPWDTLHALGKYCLVESSSSSFPPKQAGTVVHVPLRNAGIFSSVHLALLHELKADSAVGGICDLQFCNQQEFREAVADGRIANLGNSVQPSLEQIIDLNPDALLPSPFENSGGLGRVETLGIPIIWCADYMENTPLGRAEWIRFYGRLLGKAEEADSIFSTVESR